MRKFFLVVTILFTAAVVLQLYLAAVGVFSNPADELFAWHGMNGRVVLPILALLLIVTAALARAGRRTIWLSVLPLVLLITQTLLFILTSVIFDLTPASWAAPPLGATLVLALHGLNGAAILLVGVLLVSRARKLVKEGRPSGTATDTGVATSAAAEPVEAVGTTAAGEATDAAVR